MIITDVFDAAKEGSYKDFLDFFDGDINKINQYTKLNLLHTVLVNDKNQEDKIKIINYLISNGINVNYIDGKLGHNALHTLYYCLKQTDIKYLFQITKILIDNKISINQRDKYGAIPLKYLITLNKLKTEDLKEIYLYTLSHGADYNLKDEFGKSVVDYAKEYSWRNEFLDYVKEFENES